MNAFFVSIFFSVGFWTLTVNTSFVSFLGAPNGCCNEIPNHGFCQSNRNAMILDATRLDALRAYHD